MVASIAVKDVQIRKGQREEKQAKKPVVVAEIKANEECCEPGCGPDTCNC